MLFVFDISGSDYFLSNTGTADFVIVWPCVQWLNFLLLYSIAKSLKSCQSWSFQSSQDLGSRWENPDC